MKISFALSVYDQMKLKTEHLLVVTMLVVLHSATFYFVNGIFVNPNQI